MVSSSNAVLTLFLDILFGSQFCFTVRVFKSSTISLWTRDFDDYLTSIKLNNSNYLRYLFFLLFLVLAVSDSSSPFEESVPSLVVKKTLFFNFGGLEINEGYYLFCMLFSASGDIIVFSFMIFPLLMLFLALETLLHGEFSIENV